MTNGNLKRMRFYVCPDCGNLLFSMDGGTASCCGNPLPPLEAREAPEEEQLKAVLSDGSWYITGTHEMHREHYVSFAALLADDTLTVKKLYPEWGPEFRLPCLSHGTLLWYCTRHSLFRRQI